MLKDRLRILIETLGIRKGEFADQMHFSQAYISMILSGAKQNPSDRFYESARLAFSVSPNWLRNGEGEMFLIDDTHLTPMEKELVAKYNALPLSERRIIDEVVDALLLKSARGGDAAGRR